MLSLVDPATKSGVHEKHSHNFLDAAHIEKEFRTWAVISICFAAMVIEITCGTMFGSLALVADGLHMGTHVIAFFITAASYSYSRLHCDDERFVFGTGKVGDLSSFTCAIILLGVSLLIVYEGVDQLVNPVELHFVPALVVSFVGLSVNVASGFFLLFPCGSDADGHVDHGHGHNHGHAQHQYLDLADLEAAVHSPVHEGRAEHDHHGHGGHDHDHHDECFTVQAQDGTIELSIFEDGVPPEFRIQFLNWKNPAITAHDAATQITVQTTRHNFSTEMFAFEPIPDTLFLRSTKAIPEPHEFRAELRYQQEVFSIEFAEHDDHSDHDSHHATHNNEKKKKYQQDNGFRAAVAHVLADAFVSVLTVLAIAIAGTVPGAWWLNPAVGIFGSLVIASWAFQLLSDALGTLLDLTPDPELNKQLVTLIEADGTSAVVDIHTWRLGPGRLGAIFSISTTVTGRTRGYYWSKLKHIKPLAHATIEILD